MNREERRALGARGPLEQREQIVTTRYALNTTQKKVVAEFSQPLANLSMHPTEAVRMAQILLACSRELDPDSVAGHTWPGMDEKIQMTPIAVAPEGAQPQ